MCHPCLSHSPFVNTPLVTRCGRVQEEGGGKQPLSLVLAALPSANLFCWAAAAAGPPSAAGSCCRLQSVWWFSVRLGRPTRSVFTPRASVPVLSRLPKPARHRPPHSPRALTNPQPVAAIQGRLQVMNAAFLAGHEPPCWIRISRPIRCRSPRSATDWGTLHVPRTRPLVP